MTWKHTLRQKAAQYRENVSSTADSLCPSDANKAFTVAVTVIMAASLFVGAVSVDGGPVGTVEASHNGTIYSTSDDGTLKAYTDDGQTELWSYNIGGAGYDVAELDGYVYLAGGGEIHKLNSDDGSVVWTREYNATPETIDVDLDGDIYSNVNGEDVSKIDGDDGEVLWNYTYNSSYVVETVEYHNGYAYAAGENAQVHKIDADTGSGIWDTKVGTQTNDRIWSLGVDESDDIYIGGSIEIGMQKLDGDDGSNIWTTASPPNQNRGLVVGPGGYIYHVGRGDGDVVRKLDDGDGDVIWSESSDLSAPESIALDSDGNVYAGDSEGDVEKFDGEDGTQIWIEMIHASSDPVNGLTTGTSLSLPEYTVSGTVTDDTGEEIEGATVEIQNDTGSAVGTNTTDENGEWSTELEDGEYTARVSADGYRTATEEFTVDGEPATVDVQLEESPLGLELDTDRFMEPGEDQEYSVYFTDDNGTTTDVTDDAEVTSSNTSVVVVNTAERLLEGQEGVNDTSLINASYTAPDGDTHETEVSVTVAEATVENLEILPTGLIRLWAIFGDSTMFAIMVAALLSVPAARFSTAFGGLAVAEMVIVVGWLAGYVGIGIAMTSIFMAMFIGLNLAENTEFTSIRR